MSLNQLFAESENIRRQFLDNVRKKLGLDSIFASIADMQVPLANSLTEDDSVIFSKFLADLSGNVEKLGIIIASPGGSMRAVDAWLETAYSKVKKLVVIVPGPAKSAATVLALGADEIVMGPTSELGPTDPQIPIGGRYTSANYIIKEYKKIDETLKANPSSPAAMLLLRNYMPGLLESCEEIIEYSKEILQKYLSDHLMKGQSDDNIKQVINYFTDEHKAHEKRISYGVLQHDLPEFSKLITFLQTNDEKWKLINNYFSRAFVFLKSQKAAKIIETTDSTLTIRAGAPK